MELNLDCHHVSNNTFGPFCISCGCIYKYSVDNGSKIYSVKYKSFILPLNIPPIEAFQHIEKQIGYKIYFKRTRANISDFYKKARSSCIKFIKKLVEDYKFSSRVYFMAILYLDLIYLNYDYFTILKDFKSELIAVGCFILAGKYTSLIYSKIC